MSKRGINIIATFRSDAKWKIAVRRLSSVDLRNHLCHGKLNVQDADPAASDGIIYATVPKGTRGTQGIRGARSTVVGFLFYHVEQKGLPGPSLYVDDLCSGLVGVGKALMQRAQEVARSMGLKYIRLSALDHVLFYYRKMGFRSTHHPQCIEKPGVTAAIESLRSEAHRYPLRHPRTDKAIKAAYNHARQRAFRAGHGMNAMTLCLPSALERTRLRTVLANRA